MKRFGSFCALLVGAALVASAVPAFPEDQQAQPDTSYKVKSGDTLWDLSGQYLKDPFKWPVIHKANPVIKNPHWIYPGEKIVIPGFPAEAGKAAGTEEVTAPAAETRAGEPFVEIGKTITKRPADEGKVIKLETGPPVKTPVATLDEIASAGFVSGGGSRVYEISGDTLDGRSIYSTGDELLIKDGEGLAKGQLFFTGRPRDQVKDPSTGECLGTLIEVTGILRVTGDKDGKMLGEVEKSFREVKKTDLLYPYEELPPVYEPVPVNDALKGKTGYVAATKLGKDTSASGDVVYLNLGSDSGVKPGDTFVIRRSGGIDTITPGEGYVSPEHYQMPDKEVGDLVVISVMPKTSSAMISGASEVVKPGYRAEYKY